MPTKKDNSSNAKNFEAKKQMKVSDDDDDDMDQENGKKNIVKKPGRTLLVSPGMGSSLNESIVSDLKGLKNSFSTKNGSYFLTFDTIENSVINHKKLRTEQPNLKVKFARYQIFFTMNGLTNEHDYTAVKKLITDYVQEKTGGEVLYFKLYRRGDNYYFDTKGENPIGYGDLTIDTKESMDLLLNKEGPLKECTLKLKAGEASVDIAIKYYRFNKTPRTDGQKSSYINQV